MIDKLTPDGLWHVMNHLRVKDHREAHCSFIVHGDMDHACHRLFVSPGDKFECRNALGVPTVVGGFSPIWPGLCAGWLWGTSDWPDVALEVTKFVKRDILPELAAVGFHRVECRAMAGNDDVIRWLKLVGFKQEAVVAQFGQGREDFILFAWTTPGENTSIH